MNGEFQITDQANDDVQWIHKNLVRYVETHGGRPSTYRELVITLRGPQGQLIAGLHGMSNWQWLFIKSVYIDEAHRLHGLGTRLLQAAEEEGRRRACVGVWLDTFSFQSPDFYRKLGYAEYGVIDDYPPGHRRYFFRKPLV